MMAPSRKRPSPLLVAIVGGSGSGKTYVARRLQKMLGSETSRISLDDFYRDLSHLPMAQREQVNFDHPRCIDWPSLEMVLRNSLKGCPSLLPSYNFKTHTRRHQMRPFVPRKFLLLEGLWLLRRPAVRRLFHHKIFVDAPAPLRLQRRIRRDTKERGRSQTSVIRQFRTHVTPMHVRYVAPQAKYAEQVLRSPMNLPTIRALAKRLRACAAQTPLA